MNNPFHKPLIVADYREVPSGIPNILKEMGAELHMKQLKSGDYILNNEVMVERKSKDDFALSIIQGRLFDQCARMRKYDRQAVLLIEGNPYQTNHEMDRQAIKGALLSVSICWQIPILYSANAQDSSQLLMMAAQQRTKGQFHFRQRGRNPKKIKSKAIYFLQGLPSVGPVLATSLLEKFGSLENIILAGEDELREIDGLGKSKAKKIRAFFRTDFKDKLVD